MTAARKVAGVGKLSSRGGRLTARPSRPHILTRRLGFFGMDCISTMEEITAIFACEKFRFANANSDDLVIGEVILVSPVGEYIQGDRVTCKGPTTGDELQRDQTYRFLGRWTTYKNKRSGQVEQQFTFQSFAQCQPHGRAGVIAYLCQAGSGNGIGKARAAKLWDEFGSDAVRVLREEPELAASRIKGLAGHQAHEAAKWLQDQQSLENCTIEVVDLLAGRGFPNSTTRESIRGNGEYFRGWGARAANVIRRDPYQLMKLRGCGYKRCDDLYLSLGLDAAKLRRQAYSIWYTLARDTDGHTWFPVDFAFHGLRELVKQDRDEEKALRLATRVNRHFPDRFGAVAVLRTRGDSISQDESDSRWVAEGKKAASERRLAELVAEAMTESCQWPSVDDVAEISDHQREQMRLALAGPIAILGGRPGTGKTYSTARLVRLLLDRYGSESVAIAAPTGKAAVRITEVMQGYGVPLRARTWHSLLGVASADGGWSFKHDERNPLPYRVLIGDETSMNDTPLMCSIFRARSRGCHVLLVGDVNQLPPVGHGAPLRDMIAAGLPYGELREIKRNSGGIVETCAAICDDLPWRSGDNLVMQETHGEDRQIIRLLNEIKHASNDGHDPVWDCQVLVAVNAKSKLSRKELNRVLQAELNHSPGVEGSPFRVGDKIVNLKNGYFPSTDENEIDDPNLQTNDKGEVYVANGELARVIHVEPSLTIAQLSSPTRIIKIPRGKSQDDQEEKDDQEERSTTGCSWDLGYAISCHKSQGSEWPVVIVMIDDYPGARMVCDRAWLYTAISRSKSRCVLIGKKVTAERFCRTTKIWQRKTFLREQILLHRSRDVICEL